MDTPEPTAGLRLPDDGPSAHRARTPVRKLGLILQLAAITVLAAVPSALVMLDRWFGNPKVLSLWQEAWCRSDALCRSAYPSYFILAFPCWLLAVSLTLWAARRRPAALAGLAPRPAEGASFAAGRIQRWLGLGLIVAAAAGFGAVVMRALHYRDVFPGWWLAGVIAAHLLGWLLREIPAAAWAAAWRRHHAGLIAVGLGQLAAAAGLASIYGAQRFQWAFAVLIVLAALNLVGRRRAVSAIGWIVTLALLLFATNMNAWWLSAIGDEYTFWAYAREIVEEQSLEFIGSQLFNGQGVYAAHPYLSSLIHALFLRLFGVAGFSWRFSNACLSAAAIAFFYIFFKTFLPRRTAVLAALFLALSHYIMSFGKIGYNNLQAFLAESWVLAAAAWAARTRRPSAFALTGAALAFCAYVYPAALYVLPIPVLLLLWYAPPTSWQAVRCWGLMAASLLIPSFPLLLQPAYWQAKVAGTLFYNPAVVQTPATALNHLAKNSFYSAFSYLFTPQEDHFIAVGYVDPLTAVFIGIGFACMLGLAFRRRFAAFLLTALALLLFLVGASHDRPFPTGTRMFLLLPWFALCAAIGLAWLMEQMRDAGLLRGRGTALLALIFTAVLGLNLYQAYPLARDRMAGFQSLETLFLRMVQRAQPDERVAPKTYVFITEPTWTSAGIRLLADVYPIQARFAEVVVTDQALPESDRALIADPNALVIIEPWMDPARRQALEPDLQALGKAPCPIRATNGDERFTLWHAPGLEKMCTEP